MRKTYQRNFIENYKTLKSTQSTGPWGVHPKHFRKLYISIIRSKYNYGSLLYDNSAKMHLFKLDRNKNKTLRIVSGFIKTTHVWDM